MRCHGSRELVGDDVATDATDGSGLRRRLRLRPARGYPLGDEARVRGQDDREVRHQDMRVPAEEERERHAVELLDDVPDGPVLV